MQSGGYMGKMLYVDLTTGTIREEALDQNIARKYIGSFGMGARLAYDLIKPGIDPLSPENFIIVTAGPLLGTSCPSSTRFDAWTKFPLHNSIGYASGAQSFGRGLKYAGYDGLIISGRADKPVYLKVTDDGAEICDAGGLWGKGVCDATDEIWRRHGTDYGIISIGQAGENQVKLSLAIVDKSSSLGRHGLGAVMGSKNLKLIAAGGNAKVRVHDWRRFNKMVNQLLTDFKSWPDRSIWYEVGHLVHVFPAIAGFGLMYGYQREICDPDSAVTRFSPELYIKKIRKSRIGCPSCALSCKYFDEVKEGEYKGTVNFASQPDYFVGGYLGFRGFEEVVHYDNIAQNYGIDKPGFAAHAAFLIDLHDKGIISRDDLEGLELDNEKSFTDMLHKVAYKQGLGAVIADGLPGILKRFGKECEKYSNCTKGSEPFIDIRPMGLIPHAVGAAVTPHPFGGLKDGLLSPTTYYGAGEPVTPELFRQYGEWIAIPKRAMDRILDTPMKVNCARFTRHSEDAIVAYDNLGICCIYPINQYFGMERLAELYSAATGIETDEYELKAAGERGWTVLKALSVREGRSRKDDKYPRKWTEPLKFKGGEIRLRDIFGIKEITEDDLEKTLDDYYDEREWDIKTGIPTREKLEEIGLKDIADDLAKQGILPERRPKGWRIGHWGPGVKQQVK